MALGMTVPAGRFPALVAAAPGVPARLVAIEERELGEGDVTIAVRWSSLNYKDALALRAAAPVVRRFPMVCGIDLAGEVVSSDHEGIVPGDEVVVTGCGLGEEHPGGFAAYARVPGQWCVPLPPGLDTRQAMALGTAGLTAMLAVLLLERNGSTPDALGGLPLLVTGAAGGVGSIAVALGARLGYRVVASTGRPEEAPYLEWLGASEVLDRRELSEGTSRALERVRFGAVIDVVGGATLARALAATRPFGTVAACGLAGGAELSTTIHPFILRGIVLAGVNSVHPASSDRAAAWHRLAATIPGELLQGITASIGLDEASDLASRLLDGRVRGRIVVAPRISAR